MREIYLIVLIFSVSCNPNAKKSQRKLKHKINVEKLKSNHIFPRIYSDDIYINLSTEDLIADGNYVGIFQDTSIAFTGNFKNNKPTGLFYYYYSTGELKATKIYEDGLQNGPFTYWDKSGTLDECGVRENDKLEGCHYTWWNYNTIRSKTWYKDGKIDGEEFHYHKNGNLHFSYENKEGKSNGLYRQYYENGELDEVGGFINGYQIGTWKEYYRNGKPKSTRYYSLSIGAKEKLVMKKYEHTFAEGKMSFPVNIWSEYDSLGHLTIKTYHDNSFNILLEEEYLPSGKVHLKTQYKGEVPYMCSRNIGYRIKQGTFEEYFGNGNLKVKGYYLNNLKNGEWKTFDSTGRLTLTDKFKNDTLVNK
jgi:antitoxin component YwqK of YwqJK toxin-antitoxin module